MMKFIRQKSLPDGPSLPDELPDDKCLRERGLGAVVRHQAAPSVCIHTEGCVMKRTVLLPDGIRQGIRQGCPMKSRKLTPVLEGNGGRLKHGCRPGARPALPGQPAKHVLVFMCEELITLGVEGGCWSLLYQAPAFSFSTPSYLYKPDGTSTPTEGQTRTPTGTREAYDTPISFP